MRKAFDREAFDRAVSGLRFDEAERLLHDVDPDGRQELAAVVEQRREEAREEAQERYRQIVQLGSADHHEQILSIRDDPSTQWLLALLPQSARRRAEAYLGAASRWEAVQTRTGQRRLAEARKALDEFDLELARGLVRRIDERYLEEEARAALDRLIVDIESRATEMKSLQETGRRLTDDRPGGDQRPWWRRWRK